jgi:hypothetical protein
VCTHTSRSILIVGIDRISFQILAASIR